MRPRTPEGGSADDLFRARLSSQLDLKHALVRLAGLIDWQRFESAFGALYHESVGRPGKPTRLMVGLTYLKHTYCQSAFKRDPGSAFKRDPGGAACAGSP